MHDLNTINRLNAEAHGASIKKWNAEGKHVLATYAGLTLISAVPYDTEADARSALEQTDLGPSTRTALYPPSPAFYAAKRDQSEDRPQTRTLEELAALGATRVAVPA